MMDLGLISVIVPVYKVEKYLDLCVASIVGQTYGNLEVILVEDGSPDNCGAMCDAWAQKDGRIRVIHKRNGGMSEARNVGIDAARGKWIMFLDSDDVFSPHLIQALAENCLEDGVLPAAGIVRFHETSPIPVDPRGVSVQTGKDLVAFRGGMFCVAALYNRDLLNRIGLRFETSLRNLEDVVWNAIYLRYIDHIRYLPVPMYYYRHNPVSATSQCVNKHWQVECWMRARDAVLNWFAGKELMPEQAGELKRFYRHCQNNIIAESVEGQLSWSDYRSICRECDPGEHAVERMIGTEYSIMRRFPWGYFVAYCAIMKLRNAIVRGRKRS